MALLFELIVVLITSSSIPLFIVIQILKSYKLDIELENYVTRLIRRRRGIIG